MPYSQRKRSRLCLASLNRTRVPPNVKYTDVRFNSGARMLYDCPGYVARAVFDSGALMLEICVNRKTESSCERLSSCSDFTAYCLASVLDRY